MTREDGRTNSKYIGNDHKYIWTKFAKYKTNIMLD